MHPEGLSVLCSARTQTHTSCLLNTHARAHTHKHTHNCTPAKIHGRYGSAHERELLYQQVSPSNTHPNPPTLFLLPHCLFHTIMFCSQPHTPFSLVKNLPIGSDSSTSLLSPTPSHFFTQICEFLYHHHIPEHQEHPVSHTLHCSTLYSDGLSCSCGFSYKNILHYFVILVIQVLTHAFKIGVLRIHHRGNMHKKKQVYIHLIIIQIIKRSFCYIHTQRQ